MWRCQFFRLSRTDSDQEVRIANPWVRAVQSWDLAASRKLSIRAVCVKNALASAGSSTRRASHQVGALSEAVETRGRE